MKQASQKQRQRKHIVYQTSQKKEIKENKETIIITESIDVSNYEVRYMPDAIIKFIKSVDNTMSDYKYNLISSDTASLVPHERYAGTDTLAITLIFKKNN